MCYIVITFLYYYIDYALKHSPYVTYAPKCSTLMRKQLYASNDMHFSMQALLILVFQPILSCVVLFGQAQQQQQQQPGCRRHLACVKLEKKLHPFSILLSNITTLTLALQHCWAGPSGPGRRSSTENYCTLGVVKICAGSREHVPIKAILVCVVFAGNRLVCLNPLTF